jgi:hypothetical protein
MEVAFVMGSAKVFTSSTLKNVNVSASMIIHAQQVSFGIYWAANAFALKNGVLNALN